MAERTFPELDMRKSAAGWSRCAYCFLNLVFPIALLVVTHLSAQAIPAKWQPPQSPLVITRPVRHHTYFDVNSRTSAAFGREDETWEAWLYPMKLAGDFRLDFQLPEGAIVSDTTAVTSVEVRPESMMRVLSWNTFTVRELIFAPATEPGVIVLVRIDTGVPLIVRASFDPKLQLMWPAPSPPVWTSYSDADHAVTSADDKQQYASIIGAPNARQSSVPLPPDRAGFEFTVTPDSARNHPFPIVLVGSLHGTADAHARFARLRDNALGLYEATVRYFDDFLSHTTRVHTDDEKLNAEYDWARVAVHRALVDNPLLGTGLVAGYGTSTSNNRPGFSWFFGRDSAWTELATTAAGDLEASRAALDFISRYQRADGKIPHEISQSASLVHWFTDYPYPWASADSTPLFIAAAGDYFRATADMAWLHAHWTAIDRAYKYCLSMDTDGNLLIENGRFGHGWIEGGKLFPAHEEFYLQGVWLQALSAYAQLASAMGQTDAAREAQSRRTHTLAKAESTYWLPQEDYYSYAALDGGRISHELTILPTVPMWWHELESTRAVQMLYRLGGAEITTDWGTRIVSNRSPVYDPVAYHYGSVWPLFTGWASLAAYQYGLPELGFTWLRQNADQTFAGPAGDVDEFFSGDLYRPQENSSHHQTWSSAMVLSPILRGLAGLDCNAPERVLTFAPRLPASINSLELANVNCGGNRFDLHFTRAAGSLDLQATGPAGYRLMFSPSLPGDARLAAATINELNSALAEPQHQGETIVPTWTLPLPAHLHLTFSASDPAYVAPATDSYGDRTHQLHVLRRQFAGDSQTIEVEGIAGTTYPLSVSGRCSIASVQPGFEHTQPTVIVRMPAGTGRTEFVRQTLTLTEHCGR